MIRKGKAYAPFEILPKVIFAPRAHGLRALEKGQRIDFDGDLINVATEHLQTFASKGLRCVVCGIEGKVFFKERRVRDTEFHFNLYALDDHEQEVLMTRGYLVPRSRGGPNKLSNWQTLCAPCRRKPYAGINLMPYILLTDEGVAIWLNVLQDSLQNIPEEERPPRRIALQERADLLDDGNLLLQVELPGAHVQLELPPEYWRWTHALQSETGKPS